MFKKKEIINIIVLGSTNSGRSTTVGHFLYKLSKECPQLLQYFNTTSQITEEKDIDFTIPLKNLQFELERNSEQEEKHICFEMNNHNYEIVDIIGHKNFVKNIISGQSKAHVVLIVAALQQERDEYDFQFEQIKQQLILAQSLGVKQIIVALNKIEIVNFSENEFTLMKNQIDNYLHEIKFNPESIFYIPVSGVKGDNLVEKSENILWYEGQTLLQALFFMNNINDLKQKPLRMPIKDIYKIGGVGTVPVGRVETGILKPGMMIRFSPSGLLAECSQFEMMHHPMEEAIPGDNMGFSIKGIETSEIQTGNVASDAERDPAMKAISFLAQIVLLESSKQIEVGQISQLFIHYTQVECRIKRIIHKIDNRTGIILEENPISVSKGGSALAEIEPLQPLCIEEYSQYPPLGRFILKDSDQTTAVGIVQKVEKQFIN
ncbi:translation elongation factor Tu protein (macronuclear) [Tetrahymena thermophila SB210]|uniref:Translation elongation factor Tu protein n=1 Tax=Tetrahymena thermophila (strain SB210) TaxID=312017 RepID=Q22GX7_TETTS|nr:translation elongation factor Tu protein [Tetrahymena thermophila SB210]EAR84547.1 translation elongation factor Tu protein [Tetrahymena thermophila SB210]|eukprot:XP_001032210.1 translation elongation factor Tu protein [Tetrahymena thermophila SB210]